MRRALAAIAAPLLAIAFFLLWPAKLGGAATFVVTHGISMEPNFHTGDLAIARSADEYHVGDVVAYRSDRLHTTVMHRIVRQVGDRFVFKGDNNSWLDPEHLRADHIYGKLWLHIPKVGLVLAWVAQPLHAALLAVGVILATDEERRRRRRRRGDGVKAPTAASVSYLPEWGRTAAATLGLVGLGCAVLAVMGLRHPLDTTTQHATAYQQKADLSYSASVAKSTVYPDGTVQTGDPVFLKLVDRVTGTVRDELATEAPHSLTGTVSTVVRVSDGNGWSRDLSTSATRSFSGDTVITHATVDVAAVQALTKQVSELTGVNAGSYTVSVIADVHREGTIAGQHVVLDHTPTLSFRISGLQLAPVISKDAQTTYYPADAGSVARPVTVPATMSVLGHDLSVRTARRAGVAGAVLALAALGGLVLYAGRKHGDPTAAVRARYGEQLLQIARPPAGESVVDVTSMEALAKLAKQYERVILAHEPSGAYFVEDEGTLYRYRIDAPDPGEPDPTAEVTQLVPRQERTARPTEDGAVRRLRGTGRRS